MSIVLAKGSLITVNGITLSDHNRGPAKLDGDPYRIGERTLSARMVMQSVTWKRKLSLNWSMLPALDSQTADGKGGRNTIQGLVHIAWTQYTSPYVVTWKEADSSNIEQVETAFMYVDAYNEELVKRVNKQQWNVSLVLVEE
jgi:hypothetical protein